MPRVMTALFVASLLTAAPADAQVKFELKYTPETKSTSQTEVSTKQILTLAGMDLATDVSQFVISTTTIGKRNEDGTLPIVDTVDKLQSRLSLPGGLEIAFDSGDPDKKAGNPLLEPLVDVFRVAAKSKTVTLRDKDNRIKSIEFPDNPAEKVSDDYKSQFDPEKRKKAAEKEAGLFPAKPVKPGDTWMHTSESDLGGGQTLTLETRYEYVGTEDRAGKTLDKITSMSTSVAYAMDPNANSPLKIKSSELTVASSEGTILFDRTRGAVVESVSKIRITGDMKTEINAMEFPAKLDLAIETKTTLQP
jgi:hypothetical protein